MEHLFFDFDEDSKMWFLSIGGYTYKMPFELMLGLRRYLRGFGDRTNILIKIRTWHEQLGFVEKQKVLVESNNLNSDGFSLIP